MCNVFENNIKYAIKNIIKFKAEDKIILLNSLEKTYNVYYVDNLVGNSQSFLIAK